MKRASVSVIIPTYNCGRFVGQAVESVLAQTMVPKEIIVVDDGSKDDTSERLQPYQRHIRYIGQENQGVSAARNHGVRLAQEEFVGFLDADDVWHPRKIELQMSVFEKKPELGLLGTHRFDWPAREFPIVQGEVERLSLVSWSQLVVKNRLGTSSVVARKSILDLAGPFDTRIHCAEDRDLWLRVAEIAALANLELPLTGYRQVEGSASKQALPCEQGMRAILGKIDERGAWQGRWLLRRKAYSYLNHSCSYSYGEVEDHAQALKKSLAALAWYPLPWGRDESQTSFERPKRLIVSLLRWLRLKNSPRVPASMFEEGAVDALHRLRA